MLKSFLDEVWDILSLLSFFSRYIFSIWGDKYGWYIFWLISSEDSLTDVGFFWPEEQGSRGRRQSRLSVGQTVVAAYNPWEWESGALHCLCCSTVSWDVQIPLRKEVFLERNKMHFKGGRCPLPFAGLGEDGHRIRAGQGVEECSADCGLCCFTHKQAISMFPFFF